MAKLTLENILEAAQIGETDDWEFKAAQGGLPSSFWDTYSAMANTDGGLIVLGVSERNGELQVDGLAARQIAACRKTLHDGLHNRSVVSHNLIAADDIVEVEGGGAKLLAVRIRAATRTERPIHRGLSPFGGTTFRRAHEGDFRCTDDQVRRMISDADPNAGDQRIVDGFGIDDLDLKTLREYRNIFASTNLNHPWLKLDDVALLEQLGAWRRERSPTREGLTLAGLLMFGKTLSIQSPEAAPGYFVDFRERLDPEQRWTDRLIPDGRWEANLFQFYTGIWPRLTRDLRIPFRLDGVQRIDDSEVHIALREAVVNALVHADYSVGGGIVIERYRDRFVIENPGTLLVSMEQLRRGGVSECRNSAVQRMFRFIGGGDQAGSGFRRIQAGWSSQHWRTPSLTTQTNPDRVLLNLPMVSLIPDETIAALEARFGASIGNLDKPRILALATALIEGEVTNARLQDLLSDHPDAIRQTLQSLCALDFLTAEGHGRWTRYRLSAQGGGDLFSSPESPNSPVLPPDSPVLRDLWGDLVEIAEPVARKGKVSRDLMRAVVAQLCGRRALTVDQLAQLLQRQPKNLRDVHLTPMVRNGELRLKYPRAPNHPEQAYIATAIPEEENVSPST